MIPLYKKIKNKKYEINQFLDKESLLWIEKNLSLDKKFKFILNIEPLNVKTFLNFVPKKAWFKRNNTDNIHGIMHILRVIIFSYILCKKLNIKNYKISLLVATLHDIKRKNDRTDSKHGTLAANWLKRNKKLFSKKFNREDINKISNVLRDHDSIKNKTEIFSKILTCADALDRYRLPKKKWWLKKKYLSLKLEEEIIEFAKRFVIETEKERILKKQSPKDSIIKIGEKYKILKRKI